VLRKKGGNFQYGFEACCLFSESSRMQLGFNGHCYGADTFVAATQQKSKEIKKKYLSSILVWVANSQGAPGSFCKQ